MTADPELTALVALMKSQGFRENPMTLRWRLIEGELPSEIFAQSHLPIQQLGDARAELEAWVESGVQPISWLDKKYPSKLREAYDFPPLILVRGQIKADERAVCIIGSQTASEKELASARRIARLVAERGWALVSGFGSEIGQVVVEEALRRRGRAVALSENAISSQGFENSNSLKSAVETGGLLLTASWPGSSATEHPLQVCAGVSVAYADVAIVTAGPQDCLSREQIQKALVYGRPLVFMNAIYEGSKWVKELVDTGDRLVTVADKEQDAVDTANWLGNTSNIGAALRQI